MSISSSFLLERPASISLKLSLSTSIMCSRIIPLALESSSSLFHLPLPMRDIWFLLVVLSLTSGVAPPVRLLPPSPKLEFLPFPVALPADRFPEPWREVSSQLTKRERRAGSEAAMMPMPLSRMHQMEIWPFQSKRPGLATRQWRGKKNPWDGRGYRT